MGLFGFVFESRRCKQRPNWVCFAIFLLEKSKTERRETNNEQRAGRNHRQTQNAGAPGCMRQRLLVSHFSLHSNVHGRLGEIFHFLGTWFAHLLRGYGGCQAKRAFSGDSHHVSLTGSPQVSDLTRERIVVTVPASAPGDQQNIRGLFPSGVLAVPRVLPPRKLSPCLP